MNRQLSKVRVGWHEVAWINMDNMRVKQEEVFEYNERKISSSEGGERGA